MYFVDQRKLELLQCQVRRNIFRLFSSRIKSAYVIALGLFSLHLLKIELKWLCVVYFQLINYEIISPQFLLSFKGSLNTLLNTHTDLSFQINTVLHNFYRYGQVSKGLWLDEASQMKQKQRRSSSKTFVMENCSSTALGQIMIINLMGKSIRQVYEMINFKKNLKRKKSKSILTQKKMSLIKNFSCMRRKELKISKKKKKTNQRWQRQKRE